MQARLEILVVMAIGDGGPKAFVKTLQARLLRCRRPDAERVASARFRFQHCPLAI